MSAMPGNNWGEIFYNLLVIYFVIGADLLFGHPYVYC